MTADGRDVLNLVVLNLVLLVYSTVYSCSSSRRESSSTYIQTCIQRALNLVPQIVHGILNLVPGYNQALFVFTMWKESIQL